jgi:AbiV family abortive infection protein
MPHPDRIIPVARLSEGLRLCARNIRDFVTEAELILTKGHGWHAIALAIFAFEELGKYAELRRFRESSENKDSVPVPDALFRFHDYKQKLARELVPEDAMILLPTYFDSRYFSPEFFGTESVTPTPTLRTQCVFVDWIDGDWRIGAPHDTERLKKFLNAIMDSLNKLEVKG